MSRRSRVGLFVAASVGGVVLLAVIAAFLILPSHWFEEKVRDRIVAEVERVTGGRAEIGAFRFDWQRMTAHVSPFVLHGTEPATAAPLLAADSIDVGLTVVSFIERNIHVNSLRIQHPRVNITVEKDGSTNIPAPHVAIRKNPVEDLLTLAIRNLRLSGGVVRFADQQFPLELDGQNLEAQLTYNAKGPRYRGTVKFEQLRVDTGETLPVIFALDSRITLERNRIGVESANLAMPRSNVGVSGELVDFRNPRTTLHLNARGDLAELGQPLRLPPPHIGTVAFNGTATYSAAAGYEVSGRISGRGLGLDENNVHVRNASFDSGVRVIPGDVTLHGLTLKALDGSFTGAASVTNNFQTLRVNGAVTGVSVAELARAAGVRDVPWNGTASGPVEIVGGLRGTPDMKVAGTLAIKPVPGAAPVDGNIEFAYDRRAGSLELGNSYLNTAGSRVSFNGGLGRQLHVRVEARNLGDLVPLLAMAGKKAPQDLPLRLNQGGSATFEGTVTGPATAAQISGSLHAANVIFQNETVDRISADVQANPSSLRLTNVSVAQGPTRVQGNIDLALRNWQPAEITPLAGRVRVENAPAATLLARAGLNLPVEGTVQANVTLAGTSRDPAANGHIVVLNPVIYGERLDRFTADVRYAGTGVEIVDGVAQLGAARLLVSGTYTHPAGDWNDGRVRFNVSTNNVGLGQIQHVQELRPGARGAIDVNATGEAAVRKGEFLIETLTAHAAVRQLAVAGQSVGNIGLDAKTAGRELTVALTGNLRGSDVRGNGVVQLTGDYQARGELTFAPMDLRTMLDLARTSGVNSIQPPPFEATARGQIAFGGPVRKPELMTARLELPELRIAPTNRPASRTQSRDLTLHNEGTVIVELGPGGTQVRSARFVGPDTNLAVTGTVNYKAKSPWDLKVNGNVNLAVLSDFNSDIISSGAAAVAATVRGTLADPQVEGSLELKNASFYVTDFPNGLDQANGTIIFDRNRATIRRLTGATGGGQVTVGGFIGFGTGEWTYRLTARAEGVRIRYPEGVSFTANGVVSLNGTQARSLASGTITVLRAGFNPRTDVGGLLVASAKPIETPAVANETLRNLQLDVRVETVPNLTFQTSLTQNLQAEADLRIRGTAAKPSVLGHITINQGAIQFFGNTYTITRGEIGFYNPVRIEPVVDLDLETKVRGIVVDINFAGSISKLNVSYRSDPPLQSNEIVALLAVGRAPGETTGIAASQVTQTQNALATSGNSLLGQAVSAPMSNRLQRFFGVSRVKIDPSLQNLDAVPQARLTLEQQISKDITLTYITNLTNTNQQIVRLQWDINKKWSVLAVRDEYGLFGIDFLYKRRFR